VQESIVFVDFFNTCRALGVCGVSCHWFGLWPCTLLCHQQLFRAAEQMHRGAVRGRIRSNLWGKECECQIVSLQHPVNSYCWSMWQHSSSVLLLQRWKRAHCNAMSCTCMRKLGLAHRISADYNAYSHIKYSTPTLIKLFIQLSCVSMVRCVPTKMMWCSVMPSTVACLPIHGRSGCPSWSTSLLLLPQ